MNAAMLLSEAEALLGRSDALTAGDRRATVLLLRQALEAGIDERLGAAGVHRRTRFTAQLLVLPAFVTEPRLARRVAWAWASLSGACHHCGLPPTRAELLGWAAAVGALVEDGR